MRSTMMMMMMIMYVNYLSKSDYDRTNKWERKYAIQTNSQMLKHFECIHG